MRISDINAALSAVLENPSLGAARSLEDALRSAGFQNKVFGRVNQKASLEANSESDRGIAERLANAFDASLTAARLAVGIAKSTRELTPRKAAQRFFSPTKDKCEWKPPDKRVSFDPPCLEFWLEPSEAKVRYKRYHTTEGLCTVLVNDFGMGIARDVMPSTILDLNSDSKLQAFEAIGQFGHGGSSSLAFCESVLVVSQPRLGQSDCDEFSWTLVVPERVKGDSKQELIRHWFCEPDGLPFRAKLTDFPALAKFLPGTAVWHFGYSRHVSARICSDCDPQAHGARRSSPRPFFRARHDAVGGCAARAKSDRFGHQPGCLLYFFGEGSPAQSQADSRCDRSSGAWVLEVAAHARWPHPSQVFLAGVPSRHAGSDSIHSAAARVGHQAAGPVRCRTDARAASRRARSFAEFLQQPDAPHD